VNLRDTYESAAAWAAVAQAHYLAANVRAKPVQPTDPGVAMALDILAGRHDPPTDPTSNPGWQQHYRS
jgi:hypothetical protein